MSKIALVGNPTGAATFTIQAPATETNRALTLPDAAGNVVLDSATQTLTNKTLTSPTLTAPTIDSAQVPTVSGAAPLYMCRAWVNFNGTGTVAIRASGNVSSITDNGVGLYQVNFTNAMIDNNYAVNAISYIQSGGNVSAITCEIAAADRAASNVPIITKQSGTATDSAVVCVTVHR